MPESAIGAGGVSVVPGSTQGVLPQWFGMYYATVANNADPLGLGRCQLNVPQVLGTEISTWAWALTTPAGTGGTPGSTTAPPRRPWRSPRPRWARWWPRCSSPRRPVPRRRVPAYPVDHQRGDRAAVRRSGHLHRGQHNAAIGIDCTGQTGVTHGQDRSGIIIRGAQNGLKPGTSWREHLPQPGDCSTTDSPPPPAPGRRGERTPATATAS